MIGIDGHVSFPPHQEKPSSAGAMKMLSAAYQRACRSHSSSTGQPCTQCRCRRDAPHWFIFSPSFGWGAGGEGG